MENALGTQKSYLYSIKLFYDFWLEKFGISLDLSFHKSGYHDIELITRELFAFWDYLLAEKQVSNVAMLPTYGLESKALAKKKRTATKHCITICNFIQFLSITYISTDYRDESPLVLRRYRSDVQNRLDGAKQKFAKWRTSNKTAKPYDSLHSLTEAQYKDFISVIAPNVVRPLPSKLSGGRVEVNFELIKVNRFNSIVSYEVQIRNYLLITLLVRYGLRIGESLLLRKESFLKFKSDSSKVIMRVRNLEDSGFNDSKMEDARNYKPKIKNLGSIRDVEVTIEDYRKIELYYEYIRSKKCTHSFIFSASKAPFKPVSYSTIQSQFSASVKNFQEHFPEHFSVQYADSISDNITPHWLRHTWAYATLAAVYEKKKKEYINSGVVNLKGLMDDAQNDLRELGGWSKKSILPAKYAKRFIQEQANSTLMEVYRAHYNIHSDPLNEEEWKDVFS
ncbi:site-specific integrase [Vibrio sp. Vb339]|uniref:site-specific integrase n=1 Tax=Vibrio sp. Vb339 TaxID=1192013 RepID=UPI0015536086|nr:site-specific integrase [Vibrio sp. Vb339]